MAYVNHVTHWRGGAMSVATIYPFTRRVKNGEAIAVSAHEAAREAHAAALQDPRVLRSRVVSVNEGKNFRASEGR